MRPIRFTGVPAAQVDAARPYSVARRGDGRVVAVSPARSARRRRPPASSAPRSRWPRWDDQRCDHRVRREATLHLGRPHGTAFGRYHDEVWGTRTHDDFTMCEPLTA